MRVLTLFTLGFAFSLGIVLGNISFLLSCGLLLVGVILFYGFSMPSFVKSAGLFFFGAFCAVLYQNGYTTRFHEPLARFDAETVWVEALVLEFPEEGLYNFSVLTEVTLPTGAKGKTLVYGDEQIWDLVPGDRFFGEMSITLASSTYSGIDITYYYERGILMRGKNIGDLEIIEKDGIALRHFPVYMAKTLRSGIEATILPEFQGVILALVTGNKDGLSDSFYSGLTRSGLSHTVAVSGMHLSFFALIFRKILPVGKTWASLLFMFVLTLFMLVSGSTPSIMRATVMLILLEMAPLFGRERDDATALSTAVLLILLHNPYTVTHVGLLLSVASVSSIFCFTPWLKYQWSKKIEGFNIHGLDLEKKHSFQKKLLNVFLTIVSTSIGAMILTTPLVAVYFDTISLIAPFANVLCLTAVTFCFMFGLTAAVVGVFSPTLGTIIGLPASLLAFYLQCMVPTLGTIPFAAVTTDSLYYVIWVAFLYLMVTFYLVFFPHISVIFPLMSGILGFLLAFTLHTRSVYTEGIVAQVLDVGQGQSALFYMGKTLVVADCGGSSYDNAGDLVADRVNMLGRGSLDLLFLSHCDADHANGVIQLMDRVFVERILMPPLEEGHILQEAIVDKALKEGTELIFVEEFLEYSLENNQRIRVYPPVGEKTINERGICLLLSVDEQDILMTGDMGSGTEERLISTFDIPDIEVLFVGHHGSRFSTSADFLDTVAPEMAIISVSGTNTYGHPTQEVLDKLEERDIQVFRTDEMGLVEFSLGVP